MGKMVFVDWETAKARHNNLHRKKKGLRHCRNLPSSFNQLYYKSADHSKSYYAL